MAVTFDAAASAVSSPNVSVIAWPHVIGAGANGIVLVGVATGTGGAPDGTIAPTVNGNGCTLLYAHTRVTGGVGTAFRLEVWYALAPAAGEAAIEFDRGETVQTMAAGSASYHGVDQTDPFGAEASEDGGANTVTSPLLLTVAAALGDMVADFVIQQSRSTRELTPAVGQSARIDCPALEGDPSPWLHSSDKAGAASVDMGWSHSDSDFIVYTHYAVALKAAATGTEHEALSCTPGAVAITGQSATLRAHRVLSCSSGAIVLTGQAATLRTARRLEAQAGTVAVTGTQATLRAARQLVAQPGAVTITGVNATLTKNAAGLEALTCTPGTFAIAGQAATLRTHRELVAQPGAVALSGQAATLAVGRALLASPGAVTISGQLATLRAARRLDAQPGAVTITGQNATLTYSEFVAGTPGRHPLSVEFTPISRSVEFTAITRTVEFTPITRTVEFTDG